jgi:hypothetical protein
MSKIFYDHLIILTNVETELRDAIETAEEREELWLIIDEIIHHRILGLMLEKLPNEFHEEFLSAVYETPYDIGHMDYLNEHTEGDIEEIIRTEVQQLEDELINEIIASRS